MLSGLTDKIAILSQSAQLARAAGPVVLLLQTEEVNDRQCDKQSHVQSLTELRRLIAMMTPSMKEDVLARVDQDASLSLPFSSKTIVTAIYEQAKEIAVSLESLWAADVNTFADSLQGLLPQWQPFKEKLLSNTAVMEQLLGCSNFGNVNALSAILDIYIKGMKAVNADGHGKAFAPEVIKKAADSKSYAVDSVCMAFALAQWHLAIKVQPNLMVRCGAIKELKSEINNRGSVLTQELVDAFAEAEKVDFKVALKADGEGKADGQGEAPAPAKKRRRG